MIRSLFFETPKSFSHWLSLLFSFQRPSFHLGQSNILAFPAYVVNTNLTPFFRQRISISNAHSIIICRTNK